MTRWSHGRKRIREALDLAATSGLDVKLATGHGHTWGYVICPVCGARFNVWSSPKNDDNHAKRMASFIRQHERGHGR